MTRPAGRAGTGDLGGGTYRNPVLAADWSDPDVVRAGEDDDLTASSFGRAPGLPLLHSRDLVNWTIVGHALERLEPAAAFTAPRQTVLRGVGPLAQAPPVLAQGDTDVNGPHQGGWVRTQHGEDWFLHFQQSGAHGRLVHLQPMRWGADGWPVLGDGGAPVRVHRKPDLPEQPPSRPAVDDTFPGGRFGRQWQWTANPDEGWATQHAGDGLRLGCVRTDRLDDLRSVPHVLTQRLPARACAVEVGLRLDGEAAGARAGLVVLGDAYAWIGLERAPGTARSGWRTGSPRPTPTPSGTRPARGRWPGAGSCCGSRSRRTRAADSRTPPTAPMTVRSRWARSSPPHPLALGRRAARPVRGGTGGLGTRRDGRVLGLPRHSLSGPTAHAHVPPEPPHGSRHPRAAPRLASPARRPTARFTPRTPPHPHPIPIPHPHPHPRKTPREESRR
ncbi:hypothetical protein SNARM312S_07221 [Streptomyces narbonensis]